MYSTHIHAETSPCMGKKSAQNCVVFKYTFIKIPFDLWVYFHCSIYSDGFICLKLPLVLVRAMFLSEGESQCWISLNCFKMRQAISWTPFLGLSLYTTVNFESSCQQGSNKLALLCVVGVCGHHMLQFHFIPFTSGTTYIMYGSPLKTCMKYRLFRL